MQYLVKTTTHETGEVFHDVVKARENEELRVIEVDNNTFKEVLDKTKEHIKENGYTINIDMN